MKIVDEMNSLGMSKADSKKYDALEMKREGLYTEALPYLEAAYSYRSDKYIAFWAWMLKKLR